MDKMKKKWIAAGVIAAGAAAAGAASHVFTKYMMDLAMDRKKPKSFLNSNKSRQIIRGTPYQEAFLKEVSLCAERLKNSDCERVEITSRDGIRLVGHLRVCKNAKRIILAMHGWRSTWDQDFGMIADFWNQNSCSVLFAEQRGQNDSGGDYMGFGMLERHDCVDWLDWLNTRFPEHLPIYLAGVSMGASTVLMAAGLDLPDNVKGIAADCGYTSPQEIWKHITTDNLHLSYGIRRFDIDDLCRKKIQLGPSDCSTTDALRKTSLPILLIHGTDDTFVPVEMSYENYKACSGLRKLLVVPGADHGMSYYAAKDEYEKAVKEFWQLCEKS